MGDRIDEVLSAISLLSQRVEKVEGKVDGALSAVDGVLSAISMLSQRIEKLEDKVDRLSIRVERVELLATEMAKKLLAPAEQRALGITCGSASTPPPVEPLARAAKAR